MRANILYAAVVLSLAPVWSRADVLDSGASGFTVRTTITIQASPTDVYRNFVHNVGDWWNQQHTFSHDAHNLSMEEKAMGCFCEKLPNQGSVRHMELIDVEPGKRLVMIGAMGPMQTAAATGTMTLQFTAENGGTRLQITYAVAGYSAAGMAAWAGPSDAMLKDQFTRLKNFVEHGAASPGK